MLACVFLLPTTIFAQDVSIDEDNVNVRSGPGTTYERIDQVNEGETYDIIAEEEDWVEIRLEDGSGWITKEFTTINGTSNLDENPEEPKSEPSINTVEVQVDGTHLREGPSSSFDIVAFTDKGQHFDVSTETDNWLEVSNGETTGFVLKSHLEPVKQPMSILQNKTIVIDPGHGGRDVGAIGLSGSFEKDITYLTAHELEKELTALGAEVILTRKDDEFVPLESRTTFANSLDTDAFLSIHYNSFPESPSVTGIETFYYHEQYEQLATLIHEEIIKEADEDDRGVSSQDLHVTRQTFKAGILLELGFLSNEKSESLLQTTGYQKQLVTGIINGLQRYFATQP